MFHKIIPSVACAALLFSFSAAIPKAHAQDSAQNDTGTKPPAFAALDIPVSKAPDKDAAFNNDEITHPPLRLTPDKSSIVTLERSAGSIIVGNPAHVNILADSANRLIVVPRAPGASFFTVLDKDGQLLMQRHVIIASPKEKYLRVRNTCSSGTDCQPTSVYYCPDMCHEIITTETQDQQSGDAAAAAADSGASDVYGVAGDNASQPPPPEQTDINE
ncbi:MAG: hypothetical protein CMH27_04160 [Micavibrio sp.]|nr:hypothetical protein [Micavibrio sp.]